MSGRTIGRAWVFAVFLCVSSAASTAERAPNVIIIYTDDQGTVDAGCYGAEDLETPNIDRLAANGIRFTQFYAPAPVCSPSRAGLLTGRYPVRAGVPGNVSSRKGRPGMPPEQVTIAEIFRAAGYATAHVGKWHLGYRPDSMPNAQGFDFSFGHMGGCIDNYSHYFYWSGPNVHDLYRNGVEVFEDGRFFPDLMVEEAGTFMEAHRDEPFFIYFAMNSPHYPYQGEPKWLAKYTADGVPYPRNLYNAFLSTLDERIGALMKRVDALGLREDTIVVFQSDHGHSTEERAHGGGGSAGPYRGAKFSLFEGGIRVPAIISWPGHLPEGETRDQIGHGCDWLPTLAALCDVNVEDRDLDGLSLVPLLMDGDVASPHDVLIWSDHDRRDHRWAVRQGDWKLLGNPLDSSGKGEITKDDALFLVNLDLDPSEMKNLASDYPAEVERLETLYMEWRATLAAARPYRDHKPEETASGPDGSRQTSGSREASRTSIRDRSFDGWIGSRPKPARE